MVQPIVPKHASNSHLGFPAGIRWAATLASWAALQVLLFLVIYRLRVEANIIKPGSMHWYDAFVNSDFLLFGLGPFVTFSFTIAGYLWLRWPHGDVKAAVVRGLAMVILSTFVSVPVSCMIAFNLWGT